MPITSTSVFNAVVLSCNCSNGEFGGHWVQQGTTGALTDSSVQGLPIVLSPTDSEVAEVIARVKAGAAHVYYYDDSVTDGVWARADDAPFEFWQFHGRHPFWPTDGFKMLDRLATKGDLTEETNSRHFQFKGGFVPERVTVASATVSQDLSDWVVSLEGTRAVWTLSVPVSEEITTSLLATYAPAQALRNWLNDRRGMQTTGNPPPNDMERQPELPASLASSWGSTTMIINQAAIGQAADNIEIERLNLGLFVAPGTSHIIRVRIEFGIDPAGSGGTFDIDALNRLMQTQSVNIPGSGRTVEPQHGSTDVPSRARKLIVADAELELANGIAVVKWTDPGTDVKRTLPLGGGYGRSLDYSTLPNRSGGGKRTPRPEEFPRADIIHYTGAGNASLYFESMPLFVGYSGADRRGVVHNRSAGGGVLSLYDPNLNIMMAIQPDESFSFRATMGLDGSSELVGYELPTRYQIVDYAPSVSPNNNYYSWSDDGSNYRVRPWVPVGAQAIAYERNDTDEFSTGSATITDGANLISGFVESNHVIKIAHDGDLELHQDIELEVLQSGTLTGGHSAVIVRKRGSSVTIVHRDSQPELTGVGVHRTYTNTLIEPCEAGDIYLLALLYPTAGTTVNWANGLRINDIRREIRVTPRITIT